MSTRLFACFAILTALSLGACSSATRAPVADAAAPSPRLKVMTYNVNYGLAGDPSAHLVIRDEDADVVLLQETNAAWELALRQTLADVYPHMAFKHCCGAGGLAILSKHPIDPREYARAPKPGWFPSWRVLVETPLGVVQTLNVHLRPPVSDSGSFVSGYFTTPEIRLDEITSHSGLLDPDLPAIVAGDFNEADGGKAVSFLEQRGLSSVLPEFHPGANTWRWNTSAGPVSAQLDHITYDDKLTPLNSYVVREGRSDHFPVVAVFAQAL